MIDIDPEVPLWEEMCLGNVWVDFWGTDFETAPAYVHDPNVCKGIKMVLQLDRIAEERQCLTKERENLCQEQACAVFIAARDWRCYKGWVAFFSLTAF